MPANTRLCYFCQSSIVSLFYAIQCTSSNQHIIKRFVPVLVSSNKLMVIHLKKYSYTLALTPDRQDQDRLQEVRSPIVLCKTCSVLMCVLEQPRVINSRAGTNWLNVGPGLE